MHFIVLILWLLGSQSTGANIITAAPTEQACHEIAAEWIKANEDALMKRLAEKDANMDVLCVPIPDYDKDGKRVPAKGSTRV